MLVNETSVTPETNKTDNGDYVVWLIGTLFTQIVCAIGLVSNALGAAAIFGRRLYKKAPIFFYFGWIAAVDLLHVITVPLTETNLLYLITDVNNPRSYSNIAICKALWVINWPTGDLSVILVVAAHAYKLYCMWNPFKLIQKDTTKAVAVSCIVITIVSYGLDAHLFWTADITVVGDSYVCHIGDGYPLIRKVAFLYVLSFICVICPSLLIFLAVGISYSVLRGYSLHKTLMKTNVENKVDVQKSSTYETAKNSLLMLLPISLMQVVGTLPFGIVLVISYADESFDAGLLFTFVAFLNHSNYAFNVVLQFTASKFYRNALLGRL